MLRPIFFFVLVLVMGSACSSDDSRFEDTRYEGLAIRVANWLEDQKITKDYGVIWRSSDEKEGAPIFNAGLYNGSAGVVLFYLELHHQTGNEAYLQEAKLGADYLLSAIPDSLHQGAPGGLYIGSSGIGYTLGEVYKVSKEEKYLQGVRKCVSLLDTFKTMDDMGHNWGANTDLISGNTGIGLFLLYAYRDLKIESALSLATGVGKSLIAMSRDTVGGKKWMMLPTYPRYMPNFSHGTAGTSYFLAALFEATKEEKFRSSALEGAEHLLSITNNEGLIYHHDPDTTGLVYYGFCHGPTGTSRLYQKLSVIEGSSKWNDAIERANMTMFRANLVEDHPEGFWKNVGQCCGSAGVADYYLSMYQMTDDQQYLDRATEMAHDIIKNMTETDNGIKWIHAENRSQPEFLQAQTGYMQGAAGIGMHFLRLHAVKNGKSTLIRLPDSPF